jgi:hypothetical protein
MKWLSAGVTLVNVSTVSAVLLGMAAGGLGRWLALLAMLLGVAAAVLAFLWTDDTRTDATGAPTARSAGVWFWLVAFVFGFFAFRAFCWVVFADGNQVKVQSPNNLGDLALHFTYIRNFASGVPLWPENPIHPFSYTRYPAGADIFNSLLLLLGVDLTRGLIWTGLLASLAAFYALYRCGGVFTVAGFLFNGGLAGFQVVQTLQFLDYQGDKSIAWKSLPLSMLVTQRGILYALPVGLLLLWHWRAKFFPPPADGADKSGHNSRGPLPFWLELSLYATMPLFHVHTFMALSFVAAFFFVIGPAGARRHLAMVVGAAFLPATFLVWTITDRFRARSMLAWNPGWVQNDGDFAAPFLTFWLLNFGVFLPLILAFLAFCVWRVRQNKKPFSFRDYPALAFATPAALLFLFACLVKTAPWEWDNIKLIIWAYLIMLPFLWRDFIAHWPTPARVGICIALFTSGFVSLFGGLVSKENGFGIAERSELDAVGHIVRRLPADARFATWPTYNHPVLLHGRRVVLGYPGHLWTQGFDYAPIERQLTALMNGAATWRDDARALGVRYLFWGKEEKNRYPQSKRPWEQESAIVGRGAWGAIYDLNAPAGTRDVLASP